MSKTIVWCILMIGLVYQGHAQSSPDEAENPMAALNMLFGGAIGTNQVVHQSELKALLPATFAGMKRVNVETGKIPALGMNISYAEADYENDDARVQAKISDIGGMGEFMKMAEYGWLQSEIERESEDGYERTTRVAGFPAQESYENTSRSGRLQIMVDSRFMVELSGDGVEMSTIMDLATAIDLKKLQSLKPQPAPAP